MIDLQERFDRAWDGEPPPADVHERLEDGRRRLRRRRRSASAVAALGLVTVLAGATAAGHQFPGTPDTVVAAAPDGRVVVADTAEEFERLYEENAGYSADGRLLVRPGWEVTGLIEDVYLAEDATHSAALEITETSSGIREWYHLSLGRDGIASVVQSRAMWNLGWTFEEWAARKRVGR